MKRAYIRYSLLSVLFLLSSCVGRKIEIDSKEKGEFLLKSDVGCYVRGGDLIVYDPLKHQLSVNVERGTFRIQTDMQNEFFHLELESLPKSIGVEILGNVVTGDNGALQEYAFLFECSKIENGKVWLWEKDDKIGVLIPVR